MGLLGAPPRPRPVQGPLVRGRGQRQDRAHHRRLERHRPRGRAQDRRGGRHPAARGPRQEKLEEAKDEIERGRRDRLHLLRRPVRYDAIDASSSRSWPTTRGRLAGQQRRALDPALGRALLRPLPRLRAHDPAQLPRHDQADHRAAAAHARARRGHIVNVSSIGVQTNPPRFSAYVASKAALDAFTRVVSSETIGDDVTFTTIHMPLVRTAMIAPTKIYDSFPTISPDEAADLICEAIRSRPKQINTRLGTFGEVAYALAPKVIDQILHMAYKVFPDSAAAKGEKDAEREGLGRGARSRTSCAACTGRGDHVTVTGAASRALAPGAATWRAEAVETDDDPRARVRALLGAAERARRAARGGRRGGERGGRGAADASRSAARRAPRPSARCGCDLAAARAGEVAQAAMAAGANRLHGPRFEYDGTEDAVPPRGGLPRPTRGAPTAPRARPRAARRDARAGRRLRRRVRRPCDGGEAPRRRRGYEPRWLRPVRRACPVAPDVRGPREQTRHRARQVAGRTVALRTLPHPAAVDVAGATARSKDQAERQRSRSSKCRCGPVAFPVEPTLPMIRPATRHVPTRTGDPRKVGVPARHPHAVADDDEVAVAARVPAGRAARTRGPRRPRAAPCGLRVVEAGVEGAAAGAEAVGRRAADGREEAQRGAARRAPERRPASPARRAPSAPRPAQAWKRRSAQPCRAGRARRRTRPDGKPVPGEQELQRGDVPAPGARADDPRAEERAGRASRARAASAGPAMPSTARPRRGLEAADRLAGHRTGDAVHRPEIEPARPQRHLQRGDARLTARLARREARRDGRALGCGVRAHGRRPRAGNASSSIGDRHSRRHDQHGHGVGGVGPPADPRRHRAGHNAPESDLSGFAAARAGSRRPPWRVRRTPASSTRWRWRWSSGRRTPSRSGGPGTPSAAASRRRASPRRRAARTRAERAVDPAARGAPAAPRRARSSARSAARRAAPAQDAGRSGVVRLAVVGPAAASAAPRGPRAARSWSPAPHRPSRARAARATPRSPPESASRSGPCSRSTVLTNAWTSAQRLRGRLAAAGMHEAGEERLTVHATEPTRREYPRPGGVLEGKG